MDKTTDRATHGRFEPRIIGFLCNWCSYSGADLAGVSRMKSPANIRIIRTMCSGRVDPTFVMRALELGADGVLIGGCHPGDCHYAEGNYKTMRRAAMLKPVLSALGVDPRRIRLEWISASEGEKFARIAAEFTETVRGLGPFAPADATMPPAGGPAALTATEPAGVTLPATV